MATAPGVQVTVTEFPTVLPASGLGEIPVLMGVAERGPAGVPVLLSGDIAAEYRRVFGAPVEGQSVYHSLTTLAAFGVTTAYFIRAVKYDDVSESADTEGAAAYADVFGVGVAQRASITGTAAFSPLDLSPLETGDTIIAFDVNDGGVDNVSFVAGPAQISIDTTGFADPLPADCKFSYRVNGGAIREVDLTGIGFTDSATLAAALNAVMVDVSVFDDGGTLLITTDRKGSSASVAITSVTTAAAGIGVATATSNGTGNVSNLSAVTFAELKTLIENQVKTTVAGDLLSVSLTATNRIRFLVMAGGAGDTELILSSASTLLSTPLGLTAPTTATGTEMGSDVYGTLYAGYRGAESKGSWGNRLSYKMSLQPLAASRGVGNDLRQDISSEDTTALLTSSKGVRSGTILAFVEDDLITYRTVQSVEAVAAGLPTFKVTLTEPFENGYTLLGAIVFSVEYKLDVYIDDALVESFEYVSSNPNLDNYIAARVNASSNYVRLSVADDSLIPVEMPFDQSFEGGVDPDVDIQVADVIGNDNFGTGLASLANLPTATKLLIPRPLTDDYTNLPWGPSLDFAVTLYCEANPRLRYVCGTPNVTTRAAMTAYRDSTGVDSYKVYMYGPWVAVRDMTNPNPNALVVIDPSAAVVGLANRVRAIPSSEEGGIGAAFAGEGRFGNLSPAVRGITFAVSKADRAALTEAGINPILRLNGVDGVTVNVMGSRTLATNAKRKSVSGSEVEAYLIGDFERRMTAFEFRDLDERNYSKAKSALEIPLRSLHRAKRLFGVREEDAFVVVCGLSNNSDLDRQNGILRARVGFRPTREAEFIFIDIARMDAGAVVTVEE
jgi:hypothetical protein